MQSTGISRSDSLLFAGFAGVSIAALLAMFATGDSYWALIPAALIVVLIGILNFSYLFYLLLFFLPLSIEYNFTSSLGTDLPTEPLMVGLMLVTIAYLLYKKDALPSAFYKHPLFLILVAHVAWILIASLNSVNPATSIKIFIAKIWYIVVFVLLTPLVIKNRASYRTAFWCVFIPLSCTVLLTLARHAAYGFSFEDINRCVTPYFRNHVNYALMVGLFYPFIWVAATWYEKGTWQKRLLNTAKVIYVIAIYFSFTRAAMLGIIAMVPFYFIVRFRMLRPLMSVMLVAIVGLSSYYLQDNRYMKFAPDYNTTITHDEFGDHLSATFEGKDVSSMERIYRWVAASRMIADKPWLGFGPGTFYPEYKSYTLVSFETWVSDNTEHSTVHNYFLLLWVEQGLPGLLIFLALTVIIFFTADSLYSRAESDDERFVLMAILQSMMLIYLSLTLNDMLESDKVGTLYFMNISLLLAISTMKLFKPDSK
jgi:O-antigen ligase